MNRNQTANGSKIRWFLILSSLFILESCALSIVIIIWSKNQYALDIMSSISRNGTQTTLSQNYFDTVEASRIEETDTPFIQTYETSHPDKIGTTDPIDKAEFVTEPPGRIVYTCFDGRFDQICLMNANGTSKKQLTFDQATNFYPSLSPNGTQIIYSSRRDGNFEIYLMNADGTNSKQLTNDIGNIILVP